MQKIIIKNFGAIKEAEIEVKNVLILIGEQASGKSTIAKLIYFFKSIGDELFTNFYKSNEIEFDELEDIKKPIRSKFYGYFGSTAHLPDFSIQYFYEEDRYLHLKLSKEKRLDAFFSRSFFDNNRFKVTVAINKKSIKDIELQISNSSDVREKIAMEQKKLDIIQSLSKRINDLFDNYHTSSLFVVAGRESLISYEGIFEEYLEGIQKKQLEQDRKKVMLAKTQTIEEDLMLEFLKETRRVKKVFQKKSSSVSTFNSLYKDIYGKTEDGRRRVRGGRKVNVEDENLFQNENKVLKNIDVILRGKHQHDEWGEKLLLENGQQVYLKDASSGQKEVIRIIQDLVLCVVEKQNAFRVIEEPEAHLFPVAQEHLIELLMYMKNANDKNQIIITTHSPYILATLNNLLFATRVKTTTPETAEEIEEYIPAIYHINPNDFAAYSLGNFGDSESEYCEDIFNPQTGVIKQNYLDGVFDVLGNKFNFLYKLHAKSLKNK